MDDLQTPCLILNVGGRLPAEIWEITAEEWRRRRSGG
jgi:hypothetical protein